MLDRVPLIGFLERPTRTHPAEVVEANGGRCAPLLLIILAALINFGCQDGRSTDQRGSGASESRPPDSARSLRAPLTDSMPAQSRSTGSPLFVPVTIMTDSGPVIFRAEVASTPAERRRGLMFREHLDEREAMLFVFPKEQQLSFWMENTLISLDLIFIRADRTILGIVARAKPKTRDSRWVPGLSQYVLEVGGGVAERLGIRKGQTVRFMVPPATR